MRWRLIFVCVCLDVCLLHIEMCAKGASLTHLVYYCTNRYRLVQAIC